MKGGVERDSNMAEQWYLERDGSEYGPYSAEHVKKLAALGRLRPTDVVRSAGMEKGVAAARVKGLLSGSEAAAAPPPSPSPDPGGGKGQGLQAAPAAESPAPPALSETTLPPEPTSSEIAPEPATEASTTPVSEQPSNEELAKAKAAGSKKQDVRKRRAVALANAVILSQDGVSVQFRKKCGTCGHEDSVRSSMIIAIGIARAGFFCPKCRKRRPVQIQGIG
jgi:hypothetical protein